MHALRSFVPQWNGKFARLLAILFVLLAALPAGSAAAAPHRATGDQNWSVPFQINANGFAIVTYDNLVYIANSYTQTNNVNTYYVNRWDGSNLTPLGGGANGTIQTLAVDSAGNLYAGGAFTEMDGIPCKVAKWTPDGDGGSWSGLGSPGDNGYILALAVAADGSLYAGGAFNGKVARYNSSTWSRMGNESANVNTVIVSPGGTVYIGADNGAKEWRGTYWHLITDNQQIKALATASDGTLYVGGSFTMDSIGAVNVARRLPNGQWTALSDNNTSTIGDGPSGTVWALAIDSRGNVYAGGAFGYAGYYTPALGIAKWSPSANNGQGKWSGLGSGLRLQVQSLAINSAGEVLAGGNLSYVGDVYTGSNFARWQGFPTAIDFTRQLLPDSTYTFSTADFTNAFTSYENGLTQIQITSLPAHGSLQYDGAEVSDEQVILAANLNLLSYTPASGWLSDDHFTWKGSDDIFTAGEATVTLRTRTNQAPVVSAYSVQVNEDNFCDFAPENFFDHASDPDGDTLEKVKIVSLPDAAHGVLRWFVSPISAGYEFDPAVVKENSLTSFAFRPAQNWNGTTTFTWSGRDWHDYGNTVQITITVNPVNDAPTFSSFSRQTRVNIPLEFYAEDFVTQYSDVEGSPLQSIKIATLPTTGQLALNGNPVAVNQEIPTAALNGLSYHPPADWSGQTGFKLYAYDGELYSAARADVTLVVAEGSPPQLTSFNRAIHHPLAFSVADFNAHFSDVGGNTLQTVKILSLPEQGTLQLDGAAVSVNQRIPAAQLDGLVYLPSAGWSGDTSFSWNATDGLAYAASPATVSLHVNLNHAPALTITRRRLMQDYTLTFQARFFTRGYSDPDGDPAQSIRISALPSQGTLSFNGVPLGAGQVIPIGQISALVYTPPAGWLGQDSFAWNAFDGSDYAASDTSMLIDVVIPIHSYVPWVSNTP